MPLAFAAKAPYKSDTAAAYLKITRGATLESVRDAVTGAVDAMVGSWTAKKATADIAAMVVNGDGHPDFLTMKYRLTSRGLDAPGVVALEREWADEDPVEKGGCGPRRKSAGSSTTRPGSVRPRAVRQTLLAY